METSEEFQEIVDMSDISLEIEALVQRELRKTLDRLRLTCDQRSHHDSYGRKDVTLEISLMLDQELLSQATAWL